MYRAGSGSLRERFLDQFEPDGDGWLYRYNQTGAAYRVTDAEKERIAAAYDRTQRRSRWAVLGIVMVVLLALFLLTPDGPGPLPFWVIYILGLSPGLVIDYVAHRTPLRFVRDRTPIAPALTRLERRRLALERLQLTVPVGAAVVTFLVLIYFALERPAIGLGSLALIAASTAGLAWAIIQGVRKWRFDRAAYAANNLI